MFCPKCGQQQLSENVRFCSRCGFQLGGVKELLANNGILETLEATAQKNPHSPRQKGMRFGAKMIFFSAVLMPFIIGLSIAADGPGFLIIPATVFFIGLARLLYALMFDENTQPSKLHPDQLSAIRHNRALPPSPVHRVTDSVSRRPDTGEMVQRPSVTEHTTELLDKQ